MKKFIVGAILASLGLPGLSVVSSEAIGSIN